MAAPPPSYDEVMKGVGPSAPPLPVSEHQHSSSQQAPMEQTPYGQPVREWSQQRHIFVQRERMPPVSSVTVRGAGSDYPQYNYNSAQGGYLYISNAGDAQGQPPSSRVHPQQYRKIAVICLLCFLVVSAIIAGIVTTSLL